MILPFKLALECTCHMLCFFTSSVLAYWQRRAWWQLNTNFNTWRPGSRTTNIFCGVGEREHPAVLSMVVAGEVIKNKMAPGRKGKQQQRSADHWSADAPSVTGCTWSVGKGREIWIWPILAEQPQTWGRWLPRSPSYTIWNINLCPRPLVW